MTSFGVVLRLFFKVLFLGLPWLRFPFVAVVRNTSLCCGFLGLL